VRQVEGEEAAKRRRPEESKEALILTRRAGRKAARKAGPTIRQAACPFQHQRLDESLESKERNEDDDAGDERHRNVDRIPKERIHRDFFPLNKGVTGCQFTREYAGVEKAD